MITDHENFALKLKTKEHNYELKGGNLTSNTSMAELRTRISEITRIPQMKMKVLFGYPRKVIEFASLDDDNDVLSKSGIRCGDTLFVEENAFTGESDPGSAAAEGPEQDTKSKNADDGSPAVVKQHVSDDSALRTMRGIFLKKEVPSDNSCLFTSLGFVLSGTVDPSKNSLMRHLVAETIASQPEEYSDAILGKPNHEYCNWILNPNSWGGAIELAVLSNYYGFEIAVVNSTTGVISRFGEDKRYEKRVFLLFDGIHYDPLYMDFIESEKMQMIFSTDDDQVLRDAQQVALEAKESKQYTDVNQFMVCCTMCSAILVGQAEAQRHAEQTGHTKFDEVTS